MEEVSVISINKKTECSAGGENFEKESSYSLEVCVYMNNFYIAIY